MVLFAENTSFIDLFWGISIQVHETGYLKLLCCLVDMTLNQIKRGTV